MNKQKKYDLMSQRADAMKRAEDALAQGKQADQILREILESVNPPKLR